ncbi:MAG: hypothetical protein WBA25_14620 [Jannaschia sp.]
MTNETYDVFGEMTPETVTEQLGYAVRSLATLRRLLDAKIREAAMTAPSEVNPDEMVRTAGQIAKSVNQVMDLEGKVTDAGWIGRGGDALDLDAARTEIGRRLDCLRDKGGAGSLS